jgi:bifunctional ADP-heptose synthase (sugar kinase/adenylyltransferase)
MEALLEHCSQGRRPTLMLIGNRPTTEKTRLNAQSQHVLRLDRESQPSTSASSIDCEG